MTKIKLEVILDTEEAVEMEALNALVLTLKGDKVQTSTESPKAPQEERKAAGVYQPEDKLDTGNPPKQEAEEETPEERKERKRQEANQRKREKRAAEKAAKLAAERAQQEAEAKQEEPEAEAETKQAEPEERDIDLINKARKLVSKNVAEHRDAIKEELARMGARNVSSVPEDKMEEFCEFLELL